MSFSYDGTIPTANQAISNTQAPIQTNFASISSLIDVDHVTFNDAKGGQHTQVTFSGNTAPASLPNTSVAIEFAKLGTANSAYSDAYLYNGSGRYFPLNILRACGLFSTSSSTNSFTGSQQINCASIATSSGGGLYTFTITLSSNTTNTNNVMVMINENTGIDAIYSFSTNVLTIQTPSGVDGVLVSFFVFQV